MSFWSIYLNKRVSEIEQFETLEWQWKYNMMHVMLEYSSLCLLFLLEDSNSSKQECELEET